MEKECRDEQKKTDIQKKKKMKGGAKRKRERGNNKHSRNKRAINIFVSGCGKLGIFRLCHLPLNASWSINRTSSTYFSIANRIDNMNEYVIVSNVELKRLFSSHLSTLSHSSVCFFVVSAFALVFDFLCSS